MSQAYCLTHVPYEGPGVFEWELQSRDYPLTTYNVPERGLPANPGDLLLVMGGPMSVNDEDPWIEEEIAFIGKAAKSGAKIIGVCLGAQMLAVSLGGKVTKGEKTEIGMTPITLTERGMEDPLFQKLADTRNVFEWHSEGIEAPTDAVVMASSELYPVQAFRYGEHAIGLLFHTEIERTGIEKLCENCKEDVIAAGLNSTNILQKGKLHLPLLHQWAHELIEHMTA